jgi:DNA-binding SARP family transcriptional activator
MAGRRGSPPQLRVQLFGQFRVWRDGTLIPFREWKTRRHQAIFKLLASKHGRCFTHDELIELLWPETDPNRAAAALRKRISELRKILEPKLTKGSASHFLRTCHDSYCLNAEANCLVDLEEFDHHYEQARALQHRGAWLEAIRAFEAAARWYHGEYLTEDRYEDWTMHQRESMGEAYLELLSRLAECYARLGEYRRAIARCAQAVEIREDWEPGYLQLMLYHCLAGHRAEALRLYERYRDMLHQCFGLDVSPAVQELHDQILQGQIPMIEEIHRPPTVAQPLSDRRERLPFVGREAEYGRLQHHLKTAGAGHGHLVLLAGKAGMGKSRLAHELLYFAQQAGSLVLHGHCAPDQLADPYQPVIEGLRRVLPQLTPGDFQEVGQIWLAEAARLIPELRNCIPNLLERPPPLPMERQPARQHEALAQLLWALASSRNYAQPLVLFLDDLHLAAPSLLNWLAYLLPRVARQPLFLLGAYRSEEVAETDQFVHWRHALNADDLRVLREMRLAPLSAASVNRLSTELAPDLPLKRRRWLVRQSGGNPLYLLALLQQEGPPAASLEVADAQTTPIRIEELVERHLQRLTHEERRLLRLAAVIGARFEGDLLLQAWGGDAAQLDELLEKLLQRHLLIVEEDGWYAFSHEQIHQAIYHKIGSERRIIHRRVAEALEMLHAHDLLRFRGVLAHHFYEAHRWAQALEYARQALECAMQAYENDEGLHLAALGLQAAERLTSTQVETARCEAHCALLLRRVTLYDRLGRREEQMQDLRQLIRLAHHLRSDKRYAEALLAQAVFYKGIGAYQRAIRAGCRALTIRQRIGDRPGEAAALNELGRAYWFLADYDEALACYRRSQEIIREIGDRSGEASVFHQLGTLYAHRGSFSEALEQYELAYRIRHELDDQSGLSTTLNNIGNVHRALGDYEKALECYAQTEEICHITGDQAALAQVLNNIGNLYWLTGMYPRAFDFLRRAYRIRTQIGDKRGIGDSLYNLGATYWLSGEYHEAIQHLEKATETLDQVEDRRGKGFALTFLAAVYVDAGEYSKALTLCQEAHTINHEFKAKDLQLHSLTIEALAHLGIGRPKRALRCSRQVTALLEKEMCYFYPQLCYWTHFKALQACGRAEAGVYLEKAYREVIRRAESLPDTEMREAFLTQVPTNSQIVRLYEELADSSQS